MNARSKHGAFRSQRRRVMGSNSFRELSSRSAVLKAVAEFSVLGRDAFLDKYGFGKARRYFLVIDNQRYDSKAIVGVAYGYQFSDRGPLK